jgi:hypothetical protein
MTCWTAAEAGHWDIVVWAVENGVSMEHAIDGHFNLCKFAASKNRWDIVQLALNNGCTCSLIIQLKLLSR